MGQEITRTRFDDETFREYERRLFHETELLWTELSEGRFSNIGEIGGYELEAWLVDHNFFPAPINQEFLARLDNPLIVPELSRFNVELNGAPLPLKSRALTAFATELADNWQQCQDVAHEMDSALMMIGILPTVRQSDLCLANMSGLKRYRALNEQVLSRRAGRPLRIHIDGREHLDLVHPDVMLEAATTSFQLHLQSAQRDVVRYFNASLIAAAPLVAAAGNSPLLFDADLWDETRISLFEQSVEYDEHSDQTNRRVSFGHGYVQDSVFECFADNLSSHPVLLPILMDNPPEKFAHIRLHNGTIWRWVRPLIGFDPDGTPHLRIEQRVLPAGPTIADMMANAALYFGLARFLASLSEAPELNLSFEKARNNFYAAARHGLDATLIWLDGSAIDARTLLLGEILPMARHGLKTMEIDIGDIEKYLDIMESRIKSRQTGSAWQRAYREKHQADSLRLTAAYLERQRSGAPVHEWEV
jgi:hypothetical protein